MKAFITLSIVLVSSNSFARGGSGGTVHVDGYYRSNGTYVQGYERTAPNNTVSDNWSTKGNVNPYTGQEGTKPNTDSYGGTTNTSSNGSGSSNYYHPYGK